MTERQEQQLKAPFPYQDIGWIINATKDGASGLVSPYVDGRAIEGRLDSVLGKGGWQNQFVVTALAQDAAFTCRIGIYYPDRQEWIWKSDGSGLSEAAPVKGGYSSALKRAASAWGIGRYLYGFTPLWVSVKKAGRSYRIAESENAKLERAYLGFLSALSNKQAPPSQTRLPKTSQAAPRAAVTPSASKSVSGEVYRIKSARAAGNQTMVILEDRQNQQKVAFVNGDAGLHPQELIQVKAGKTKALPDGKSAYVITDFTRLTSSKAA